MSAGRLAALLVALTASAALAQTQTPGEKYQQLLKGLSEAGYTSGQINAITLVATTMADVKVCAPEEGRDSRWIALTVEDAFRGFGRPREDLVARAEELVPTLLEVLADPAEKANFCGPRVPPQEGAPKQ